MHVLTVNTGSSSIKLRLLGPKNELLGEHHTQAPGTDVNPSALQAARQARAALT